MTITRDDIEAADGRTASYLRVTPVAVLEADAFGLAARLTLKLECLQHAGSFKPRGAFNRILSGKVPASGVIAASGGNHGVAVAHAARRLGIKAEIFVPEIASPVKIERLRELGAVVNVVGRAYAESFEACRRRAAETGALDIHAYDHPAVIAGQGTLARELDGQAPALDTILIAVGGGGLIGGVASWYAGRGRVVGVEPARAPTLARALEAGAPVDVEVSGIAADSLGARRIGSIVFPIAKRLVERVVLVTDDAIREAQRALWRELRVVAEPGGATALAALLSGVYRPAAGERVGVVICGGNTDPAQLSDTTRASSP
ncbi:MAG: threonine/serine dehydratase [Alphaproteobacteria bacterium]